MTPIDFESELKNRVFMMRICVLAFIASIAFFAAIAVVVRAQGRWGGGDVTEVFTCVGLGCTLCTVVAYVLLPGKIVQFARRQLAQQPMPSNREKPEASTELRSLCELYQRQFLVSTALVEGTAFIWLIFFINTGAWHMLGFAVAAALFLALKVPDADGVSRWLAQQQELIEVKRAAG